MTNPVPNPSQRANGIKTEFYQTDRSFFYQLQKESQDSIASLNNKDSFKAFKDFDLSKIFINLSLTEDNQVLAIDNKSIQNVLINIDNLILEITDPKHQIDLNFKERILDAVIGCLCVLACMLIFFPMLFLGLGNVVANDRHPGRRRMFKYACDNNELGMMEDLLKEQKKDKHPIFIKCKMLDMPFLYTEKCFYQAYSGKKTPEELEELHQIIQTQKRNINYYKDSLTFTIS